MTKDQDYFFVDVEPGITNYQYAYDSLGRRISKVVSSTEVNGGSMDTNGNTYIYMDVELYRSTYTYNSENKTVTEKMIGDDGWQVLIVYTYNDQGLIQFYDIYHEGDAIHADYYYKDEDHIEKIVTTINNTDTITDTYTKYFNSDGNIIREENEDKGTNYFASETMETILYTYDENRNISTKETKGYGTEEEFYSYDEYNNLTEHRSIYISNGGRHENIIQYTNSYDVNHQLVHVSYDYSGSNGKMTFDTLGKLITLNYVGYDGEMNKQYTYHSNGFVSQIIYSHTLGSQIYIETFDYNSNSQLTKQVKTNIEGEIVASTKNVYYANGVRQSEEEKSDYGMGDSYYYKTLFYESGFEKESYYKAINSDGSFYEGLTTYDENGRALTYEHSSSYDPTITGSYEYDANGNMIKDTWTADDGSYGSRTYTYHSNGSRASSEEITYQADGSWYKSTSTYDENWRQLTTTWSSSDGSYGSSSYTYDSNGVRVSSEDITYQADGSWYKNTSTYNESGRQLTSTWSSSDGSYGSSSYTYHSNGNQASSTYESHYTDGSWSKYVDTYDENGRALTYEQSSSYGATITGSYEYDANGNMIKDTWTADDGSYGSRTYTYHSNGVRVSSEDITYQADGSWYKNTSTYNESGRQLTSTWSSSDGSYGSSSYTYHSNGNQASSTYESHYTDGSWSKYVDTYDENGRALTYEQSSSYGATITGSYEYDANGNMIKDTWTADDGSYGSRTYTYHSNGSWASYEDITYQADGSWSKYSVTYDESGNIIDEKWENG